MMNPSLMIQELRQTFDSGRTLPLDFRLKQLKGLDKMMVECHDEITAGLKKDLGKPEFEAFAVEIMTVRMELRKFLRNLKSWSTPEPNDFNILSILGFSSRIERDPYGLVLIIAPWNCPILISLVGLIGAIAGGNVAILKTSEYAPESARVLEKLIPQYLDNECYKVITCDAAGTQELLKERYDYIIATGSQHMGKCVMEAAAKHLTPVTLELGGKSPVYIDGTCNMRYVVDRMLWGKFCNAGQACISPDYALCPEELVPEFVQVAKECVQTWYGSSPESSPDLGRIINHTHFERIRGLLDSTKGKIVAGGEFCREDLYVAPTIVADVLADDALMQEEIFGPILPIIKVKGLEDAVAFIRARPKPLAAYVFSKSKETLDYFTSKVHSGVIACNDAILQVLCDIPFGGVGGSGIGQYTGRFSYETFTKPKGIMTRSYSPASRIMDIMRFPKHRQISNQVLVAFEAWKLVESTRMPNELWGNILWFIVGGIAVGIYLTIFV